MSTIDLTSAAHAGPTNTQAVAALALANRDADGISDDHMRGFTRIMVSNGANEKTAVKFGNIIKGIIIDTGKAPSKDTMLLIWEPVQYTVRNKAKFLSSPEGVKWLAKQAERDALNKG